MRTANGNRAAAGEREDTRFRCNRDAVASGTQSEKKARDSMARRSIAGGFRARLAVASCKEQ